VNLPDTAVILSFEGPDAYAKVGGLATRATQLADALAAEGVETTLIFVGDPKLPPVEAPRSFLEYRRWSQWISSYHPAGVYDGEWGKVSDYAMSVPAFVGNIVAGAASRGKRVLVMAEEWHTAPATIALDAYLRVRGLRDRASILWNANNTYGFEAVDWPALTAAARITTVSRYMKFEMGLRGVEALVIPNGISDAVLAGPRGELVEQAARLATRRPLFVKVGRFDADKRWLQAVDAFAMLHVNHPGALMLIRGGSESYGEQVRARAAALGVPVHGFGGKATLDTGLSTILNAEGPAIVELKTFVPDDVLYALYTIADAVLANSGKEPFGYVGLEVMAAGGVAVCGSTGEDYAEAFVNSIVCDTGDGRELAAYLENVLADRELAASLRSAGRETAARFAWRNVFDILERKLEYVNPG
jgi:glycosyltransferase involved in cell wall biosynthesis